MIITAGCGISQSSFPHWYTWPKYLNILYKEKHKNIAGPAAGNEFIGESVLHAISKYNVKTVIITWTEITKIDFYIERKKILDEILTFPTRNWTINYEGKIQNDIPNWWPSSVTDDNWIKKNFNKTLNNYTQQKNILLVYIKIIQSICKEKNINCLMFFGYDVNFSDFDYQKYNIDLSMIKNTEVLANNFFNGEWAKFLTTKKFGLVPVAGWHFEFLEHNILPFLDQYHDRNKKISVKKIKKIALDQTNKCYQNHIS